MALQLPRLGETDPYVLQSVWLPDGKALDHIFMAGCAIVEAERDGRINEGSELTEWGWQILLIVPRNRDAKPRQALFVPASMQSL